MHITHTRTHAQTHTHSRKHSRAHVSQWDRGGKEDSGLREKENREGHHACMYSSFTQCRQTASHAKSHQAPGESSSVKGGMKKTEHLGKPRQTVPFSGRAENNNGALQSPSLKALRSKPFAQSPRSKPSLKALRSKPFAQSPSLKALRSKPFTQSPALILRQ